MELTSKLIFWAFFVSVGAVFALVALDRRQPARRQRLAPRGRPLPLPEAAVRSVAIGPLRREGSAAVLREHPTKPYRRTPLWRRLLAVVGLGTMTAVLGALIAIVVAAAAIATMLLLSSTAR